MRDFDKRPYSADEKRVAEWLCNKVGIGGGDDPIGFVIVSHECLAAERKHLKDVLRRFHDYAAIKIPYGGKHPFAAHHDPIWDEVRDAAR